MKMDSDLGIVVANLISDYSFSTVSPHWGFESKHRKGMLPEAEIRYLYDGTCWLWLPAPPLPRVDAIHPLPPVCQVPCTSFLSSSQPPCELPFSSFISRSGKLRLIEGIKSEFHLVVHLLNIVTPLLVYQEFHVDGE